MGAGYGLSNNWGYNNYTSYLGYGGAGVGVSPYQASGLPTYSAQVKFSMKKTKQKNTHTIELKQIHMTWRFWIMLHIVDWCEGAD